MKKLAMLLAAALAVTGLVGFSGAANASPYPGTVKTHVTKVHLNKPARHHKKITGHLKVTAPGNAHPVGHVTIVVKRHHKVVKRITKRVPRDGTVKFSLGKLKKGKYAVKMTFNPKKGSVYKKSTHTSKLRVK